MPRKRISNPRKAKNSEISLMETADGQSTTLNHLSRTQSVFGGSKLAVNID